MENKPRLDWRTRLGVLIFIVGIGLSIMAAAPTETNYITTVSSQTIDSVWDGNGWEQVASLIVIASDSSSVMLEISGLATMGPRDRLYLGLGNDSANRVSATDLDPHSNLDTFLVQNANNLGGFEGTVPFHVRVLKSNNGALTDTIYINAACGERTGSGQVTIADVVFTAQVWAD